jgi:hypothetical protein
MSIKDDIKSALKSNQDTLNAFLAELSEEDLALRQRMTNSIIAWQLGHLISWEVEMCAEIPGARYPTLPAGMKVAYGDYNTRLAMPPTGYLKKMEYLELFNEVRSATNDALARLADADLDRPTKGPMAPRAPTIGALLWLAANHTHLTLNGLMTWTSEAD